MAIVIRILLKIWVFHASFIILIITHLSILCFFPLYLICADVTSIYTDFGVLILSDQTIEVTVYECTINFPIASLEIKIELSIRYDKF
jgi:hypothetical protein